MALDSLFLHCLAAELKPRLEGGRIDKVQQPQRDILLISLRNNGENLRLLITVTCGTARVQLTSSSFDNPAEPPMFCMLMRKHLVGARIVSVNQYETERLLEIELDTHDELGFETRRKLVVELIGKGSNLVLVDPEGRITDCMRRMDFGGDSARRMLPGMIYRYPPKQNKLDILSLCDEEIETAVRQASCDKPLDKWLLDTFSGFSPLVCRELSFRCEGDYSKLPALLCALRDSILHNDCAPYIAFEGKKPLEFSYMSLEQYGSAAENVRMDSYCRLLDSFYSQRDKAEQQRRMSHQLTKTVRTLRDRQQRKLANQMQELKATEDREKLRHSAELITANIYRLKKGDRVLVCEDYYEEDCPEIKIPLDPMKSPQQNSAALFKEYNKKKAAREHLSILIAEGEKQLDYLNSVLELLSTAETQKDISDLRRELVSVGIIRAQDKRKADKAKTQAPMSFMTYDGFEVLVGRSNLQNDELTTKTGRRTDYWLHTQKIHGSHVILRCDGLEPSEQAIEQAAQIAAFYSQGRGGVKIPVDYTMLRYVKKPSGAMPGKVIYTDYRTILVEGSEELVGKLKKK